MMVQHHPYALERVWVFRSRLLIGLKIVILGLTISLQETGLAPEKAVKIQWVNQSLSKVNVCQWKINTSFKMVLSFSVKWFGMDKKKDCFRWLPAEADKLSLPDRFTYPFYYRPHRLSELAAKDLQLELDEVWRLKNEKEASGAAMEGGKMFGVLVVNHPKKGLGYLAGFSGKWRGENRHQGFVPPVYDRLHQTGFFLKGESALNKLNDQVKALETATPYLEAQQKLQFLEQQRDHEVNSCKAKVKQGKQIRKAKRAEASISMNEEAFSAYNESLRQESLKQQYYLKDLIKSWNHRLAEAQQTLAKFQLEIDQIKVERAERSAALQRKLFEQYRFLNQSGEWKNLLEIFQTDQPPSGAGNCAAPKLLQYAFLNGLAPIAMAEFWWGPPPKSAIRKHRQYYPACRSKCGPILAHMLSKTNVEPNPLLSSIGLEKKLMTVFEDDDILVINKPHDFLSVPGKNQLDSVLSRIEAKLPTATGPLIVHRLDWSTSGIMVIAKSKEVHKQLQYQFIQRLVKKRYVACLGGLLHMDEGMITLPIRVDLEDRPRQLVCEKHGKKAITKWKVINRQKQLTRVHFFPITGRTHQLRVHAAHHRGLNTPIIGDDLYGIPAQRLLLHAEWISFQHPKSGQQLIFEEPAPF